MPEVTVTLENVESKDVKVRGEDPTVYEFKASDGKKYTTFKRDVAVPGATLRGRLVTIAYTQADKPSKDGDRVFTNYYLESIKVADEALLVDKSQGTTETARYTTADSAVKNITSQSDKDVSIARAVALKAAVETAVGLQLVDADSSTILSIADVYAGWLLTGSAKTELAAVGSDDNFPF